LEAKREQAWLAALLHDVGKLRQRAFSDSMFKAHEDHGSEFVSSDFADYFKPLNPELRDAIANHHRQNIGSDLEKIVAIADRFAMHEQEADDRSQDKPFYGPLHALLPSLNKSSSPTHGSYSYAPKPLSIEEVSVFPTEGVQQVSPKDYQTLWQGFCDELQLLISHRPSGYQLGDFMTIVSLLHKYTARIPSDASHPDVSLYDHLRITAAIAACLDGNLSSDEIDRLYQGGEQDLTLCALVKGDISGTQDFLYLLTSSGAARGLRGRSFYLQMLTEAVGLWLLKQCGLPHVNLLLAGGGHFYLLMPYREAERKLDEWREKIATKLWTAHQGDLALEIAMTPLTAQDFSGAGSNTTPKMWDEVSRKVHLRKQKKWSALSLEHKMTSLFTPTQRGTTAEEMCQVCHREWRSGRDRMENNIRKCQRCHQFEELGRQLRDPKQLVLASVPEIVPPDNCAWQDALKSFGTTIHLSDTEIPTDAGSLTVYALDSTDFLTPDVLSRYNLADTPVSYDFRLLAGATPRKSHDQIAEFSDIAEASKGVHWLGVLRMDVDSLGHLFQNLPPEKSSLSHLGTLSESLRLFFEGWVPSLCRKYNRHSQGEKDALYLIYAGGDDLFVVGAWSVLPELAKYIRDDFRRFVGGDSVTLSGGIAIEHQKFPLYQLAEDAKEALEGKAKEFKWNGKEKDAICFLQMAMGWEQFEKVEVWKDKLLRMLKPEADEKALPRAFIARMAEIYAIYDTNRRQVKRWQRQHPTSKTTAQFEEMMFYHRWQWRLTYQLYRFADRYKNHETTIDKFQQALKTKGGLIDYLQVLARWTELLTREER